MTEKIPTPAMVATHSIRDRKNTSAAPNGSKHTSAANLVTGVPVANRPTAATTLAEYGHNCALPKAPVMRDPVSHVSPPATDWPTMTAWTVTDNSKVANA